MKITNIEVIPIAMPKHSIATAQLRFVIPLFISIPLIT